MSITKKLIIAVVVLSLALVGVVGGTLAFLIAESNVVTNTFTYGTITIKLTEESKTNTIGMEFSNVIPGDVLTKDPTVTVVKGSEKCYVYVLIDNQLDDAATYNISSSNWEQVPVANSGTKALYRYVSVIDALAEAQDLPVFTTLTFEGSLEKNDLDDLAGKNVVITAYAHQAENLGATTAESIAVADAAAIAWAFPAQTPEV